MDDKHGIGKIVNMLNNLGKPSMSHHPPNCSCCSNIPPPGSPPHHHYPHHHHHGHPHHRGHHHHGRYPGPPSPPRHHGHHGHRHHGRQLIPHFGPGPHGPGICPPQCGYGWHPPPHCTGSFSWVEGQHGTVPHNAVKVGVDKDGGHIYAGRAFHEGDLLPAKVVPSHGGAFVPWGGREHTKYEYEVLCSAHVGWTSAEGGEVPSEAICVGQTSDGEKLYLGRVMHEGTLTPGKIQPSHGVLYIPYGGLEISFTEYEVMVLL